MIIFNALQFYGRKQSDFIEHPGLRISKQKI